MSEETALDLARRLERLTTPGLLPELHTINFELRGGREEAEEIIARLALIRADSPERLERYEEVTRDIAFELYRYAGDLEAEGGHGLWPNIIRVWAGRLASSEALTDRTERLERYEEELRDARTNLGAYGKHFEGCGGSLDCTCGLDQAQRRITAALEKVNA